MAVGAALVAAWQLAVGSSKGRGKAGDNLDGSLTKFVPDIDRKRLNDPTLSNEEILGHEFKHAYNRKYNIRGIGITDNSIPLEEIDGLNFQNIIREKQGRTPKTTFARKDVSQYLTPTSKYKNYKQR